MKRDYLSYSALKAYAKSPAHYIQYVMGDRVETPDMKFGTAFHVYVLERESFEDRYYVMPKVDRRTKSGKAEFTKHQKAADQRIVIDETELARIMAMHNKIMEHPEGSLMMSKGHSEMPVKKEIRGIEFKGIVDRVTEQGIWDLKTVQDASSEGFHRAAYNMNYYLQAAIYCEMCGMETFTWCTVEKASPYNVSVFRITDEAMLWAKSKLHKLVEEFKSWDGSPMSYSNLIQPLRIPSWVR